MVSIYDVAEAAGYSIGTVSKVLNKRMGSQRFSDACIDRINNTAQRLGYQATYHAKSLSTGRAQSIGFLTSLHMHGAWNSFWSAMMAGMQDACDKSSYHLMTINGGPKLNVDIAIQCLQQGKVDALVIPVFKENKRLIEKLENLSLPIVLAFYRGQTSLPVVDVDDAHGIVEIINHLQQLGHKDLCWCGPKREINQHATVRELQFIKTCNELNLNQQFISVNHIEGESELEWQARIDAVEAGILEQKHVFKEVTALICYEEQYAIGAYRAFQKLGIQIPRDVSVASVDDVMARFMTPRLTVASMMLPEIGAACIQKTLKLIEGERIDENEKISARLSVAESTSKARH